MNAQRNASRVSLGKSIVRSVAGRALVPAVCALMLSLPTFMVPRVAGSASDQGQSELQGFGGANLDGQPGDCITPAERTELERKRAEYESRTGTASFSVQAEPQPYAFFPQAGTVWQDLFINNFVDLDATTGIRDWDCTNYTYDGHNGHDSDVRNFQVQAIGVPIFAALDGTVIGAHDGEPDTNTGSNQGAANYVFIDHGGGHRSIYFHMKRGSVAATPGQFVRAGTQIGLTGSSGNSTWPHLHFESQIGGSVYEPSAGPCRLGLSGWDRQILIRRELYVRDFSFSNTDFNGDRGLPFDNAPRIGAFVLGSRTVYFKVQIAGLPASSAYRFRFQRPDASFAIDSRGTFGNNRLFRWAWYWFAPSLNLNLPGTWRLFFDINDQTVVDAPFDVVTSESQIVNRPPNPITTALDPRRPLPSDVIFCQVQASLIDQDPDYQIVRYHYVWSINGSIMRDVTTAAMSDAIPKGSVRLGDNLECSVTPSDGMLAGPAAVSSINIGSTGPAIGNITIDSPKITRIDGSSFGELPRVFVNGVDRSGYIKRSSDTSITLKGKQKKIGLTAGDNAVQVIDANGSASNIFLLSL